MEPKTDLQRLLQRHGEIQRAMRQPGGIRITVERELLAIREQLKHFPQEPMSCDADLAPASSGGSGGLPEREPPRGQHF